MQKNGIRFYSLFATILFLLPLVMRLFMLLFDLNGVYNTVFYGVFALEIVLIVADTVKIKQLAGAFSFDNGFRLDIMSYLASTAFFVNFVSNVAKIVQTVSDNEIIVPIDIVSLCLCSVFAFLSSLYFVIVGLSFAGDNYDFRQFKAFHLVVILWCISQFLTVLTEIISFTYDINAVLKYLVIIFGACFFYRFVSEVENNNSAQKSTIFCARTYAYCSIFYFIDRLMILASSTASITHHDTIFALSVLFLGVFALFFEKSILSRSKCV